MKDSNLRLALLISGSGTTATAVLEAIANGAIEGLVPAVVIASTAAAGGIAKAKVYGVSTAVVDPKMHATRDEFGNAVLSVLKTYRVDLVSQNGWLPLTPINVIQAYEDRIINQHPGPLDLGRVDFGGKGMYGKRVTCARIAYAWMMGRDFWTEATVHEVTEEFDKGQVISRKRVSLPLVHAPLSYAQLVGKRDTLLAATEAVAARLLPVEHRTVIEALAIFGREGQFPKQKRRKPLVDEANTESVQMAKTLAIQLFPNG